MGIFVSSAVSGAPPAHDRATEVVTGDFVGTGVSPFWSFYGPFNVLIYGSGGPNGAWSGSVQLERCFDGNTTWIVCGVGGGGQQAVFTTGSDVSVVVTEPEKGVLYRLHCTTYASGTINYRLSTTATYATTLSTP